MNSHYLVFWLLFHGSLALRIIGIVVPSEVAAGRDALLQCHYDLEGSPLYALKWYKGSHEFYRFILKEVPPVQTFPWSSITIHHEETRSRIFSAPLAGRVLLRNVTAAAEGIYKCEISTEAPYFDTDYEEANLSVIEVSSENPIISLVQGRPDWEYDDVFHFKCSMNGTRPASRLSWLLNGQPVPVSMIELFDPVLIKNADGTGRYFNAQLGLRIKMQPHLFRSHSELEVTCISHVGRPSGNDVLESRAKWLIGSRRITGSSSNKWPDQENGRMEEEEEEDEEDDYDQVDDDDDDIQVGRQDEEKDRNATFHHSGFDDDDGTAQSISDSDSESPSRRTQPVVGSYPGRGGNNKSSSFDTNKTAGQLNRLHLGWLVSGCLMFLSQVRAVSF